MKFLRDFSVAFVLFTLVFGLIGLYGWGLLTFIHTYLGYSAIGVIVWMLGIIVPLLSFLFAIRDK